MPGMALTAAVQTTVASPRSSRGDGPRPATGPQPLILFTAHRSLAQDGLDELESVHDALTPALRDELVERCAGVQELLLLRTCQRVELYGVASDRRGIEELLRSLPSPTRWSLRTGRVAADHLARVASGQESMAVGEREIRNQLERAVRSTRSRHPRPILRTLVAELLDSLPTADPPGVEASSVAALAASKLLAQVGTPFPRVAVVGAGAVGRRVAELLAAHARLTLLFRTHPPDEAFLRATGARTAPFRALAAEVAECDALVTAAKAAGRLVRSPDIEPGARRVRPLLIIDLGMPRNVDPAVAELPHVQLVNLAQLRRGPARRGTDPIVEPTVAGAAARAWARFQRFAVEPLVAELFRAAERARLETIAAAEPYLPPMSPAQRSAVEDLTRRIVQRIVSAEAAARRRTAGGRPAAPARDSTLGPFAPPASVP